jgi:hypothetical protein
VDTNEHGLLRSLDVAVRLLEEGTLANREPGPHRVLAVHSLTWLARPQAPVWRGAV